MTQDEDYLRQLMTPSQQRLNQTNVQSADEQASQIIKHIKNVKTKNENTASNVRRAISNLKQSTGLLKVQDISGLQSSTNQSNQGLSINKSLGAQLLQPPPPQLPPSVPRNQSGHSNIFISQERINTSRNIAKLQQSTSKLLQNYSQYTPTNVESNQSTKNQSKNNQALENLLKNARKFNSKESTKIPVKLQRTERNIIIRKNSSKSLLHRMETPKNVNLNQTQIHVNSKLEDNSNEFIKIENQRNKRILNKSVIKVSKLEELNDPEQDSRNHNNRSNSTKFTPYDVIANKQITQHNNERIDTDINQKDHAQKSSLQRAILENNAKITDSTDNTDFRLKNQLHKGLKQAIERNTEHQNQPQRRQYMKNPSTDSNQLNIPLNSFGNTLQKKTINISHMNNDSSLFEMNHSLGKHGYKGIGTQGPFNLTSILRNNMLEDDGIEDMHFYQVAFNNHKGKVLRKMEHKAMTEQIKKELYEKGVIDCEEDLKKLTKVEREHNDEEHARRNSKDVKTIESVDDIEIF